MSKVQVDTIDTRSGTSTMQIGSTNTSTINIGVSGDTVNIPSGVTIANAGTATGFGGDNTPYFQVYKSANQTISNAAFTTVTFDTEQYDSGSAFSSNTFTAPSTGYYFIYSQLVYVGGTDSNYTLNRLMKNGSPINWVAFVQDSSNGAFGGRVIHLSASDAVTVQTYQQSGGNLDLNGGSEDECFFGGFKLIT